MTGHPRPRPAAEVDRARQRLYRPAATDADLARYLDLRHDPDTSAGAAAASDPLRPTGPPVERVPRGASKRTTSAAPVLLGGLALTCLIAGLLVGHLWPPAGHPSSRALVVALLQPRPGTGWDDLRVLAASDVLDGRTPLDGVDINPGTAVQLVVRCPPGDHRYHATVSPVGRLSGTITLGGRCGPIEVRRLPSSDGTMLQAQLATDGAQPFSAALVQQVPGHSAG